MTTFLNIWRQVVYDFFEWVMYAIIKSQEWNSFKYARTSWLINTFCSRMMRHSAHLIMYIHIIFLKRYFSHRNEFFSSTKIYIQLYLNNTTLIYEQSDYCSSLRQKNWNLPRQTNKNVHMLPFFGHHGYYMENSSNYTIRFIYCGKVIYVTSIYQISCCSFVTLMLPFQPGTRIEIYGFAQSFCNRLSSIQYTLLSIPITNQIRCILLSASLSCLSLFICFKFPF